MALRNAVTKATMSRIISGLALFAFTVLSVFTTVFQADTGWHLQESSPTSPQSIAEITWLLYSSALVLLMTPGVSFFYGGLVRSKNIHTTMLLVLLTMATVSALWVFVGFSLAFGESSLGGLIGNPATFAFFRNVGSQTSYLAPTIPLGLFALFQLMFAIVTAALVTGSFVERINAGGYVLFLLLWHIVVYCPMAHMVWHPDGLIHKFGVIDFAGGMVVHMASGFTACVGNVFLGAAKVQPTTKTNVPYVILGTTLLWFGWFGFNGGSAVAGASQAEQSAFLAVLACANTVLAAGSSMLSWVAMESVLNSAGLQAKEACFGVVVGLVAVTPGAGFVNIGSACCIGIISGAICKFAQHVLKTKKNVHNLEDNLDVFACHGMGGMVGVICTALFASTRVNPSGKEGLFYGGVELFWKSLVTMLLVALFVCLASYACYWVANFLIPLRVPVELEIMGLDTAHHMDSSMVLKHSNIEDILAVLNASVHGGRPEGSTGGGGAPAPMPPPRSRSPPPHPPFPPNDAIANGIPKAYPPGAQPGGAGGPSAGSVLSALTLDIANARASSDTVSDQGFPGMVVQPVYTTPSPFSSAAPNGLGPVGSSGATGSGSTPMLAARAMSLARNVDAPVQV